MGEEWCKMGEKWARSSSGLICPSCPTDSAGEEGGGAAAVSVRPSTSYGELLYRSTSDLSVARLGTANTLSSTGMVRAPSLPWHTPSPQTLLTRWRVA